MRKHILIAALILSATATAAHAAPRSLSGAQSNPIEEPVYKVQAAEPAKQAEQSQLSGQSAPPAAAPPVQAAPVAEKPSAAKQAETKPVEAKPASEVNPVNRAQRKQTRRHVTAEQRAHREFRNIEQTIGYALAGASVLVGTLYW